MNKLTTDAILTFFHEQLNIDNIDPDDELIHSGLLDSAHLLQLILFLEEHFHCNFPPDIFSDTNNFATIAKIVTLAERFKSA